MSFEPKFVSVDEAHIDYRVQENVFGPGIRGD